MSQSSREARACKDNYWGARKPTGMCRKIRKTLDMT